MTSERHGRGFRWRFEPHPLFDEDTHSTMGAYCNEKQQGSGEVAEQPLDISQTT
jgi:hypothetical protein